MISPDQLRALLSVARECDVLSFEVPVEGGVLRATLNPSPVETPEPVVDPGLPDLGAEAAERRKARVSPRGVDPHRLFGG